MNTSITTNHDGINILVEWTIKKASPSGSTIWTGIAKGLGEDGSEWRCEFAGAFVGSLFIINEYFLVEELWNETIKQN